MYSIARLNHINAIENVYRARFDTEDEATTEAMKKARTHRKKHIIRWHGIGVDAMPLIEAVTTVDQYTMTEADLTARREAFDTLLASGLSPIEAHRQLTD